MSLDEHLENQANERSEMHDDDKPRRPGTKIKKALKDKKEHMAKKLNVKDYQSKTLDFVKSHLK